MDQVRKIYNAIRYCIIATADEAGNPWAAPVFYAFDDENLYWWSDTESQHSRNISQNPNVYLTIFDSTVPEGEGNGLYIRASAQVVLEDEIEHARAVYNAFAKTFALTPENTTGDSVMKLYKATPEKIWVNAEGSRDGQYIDVRREVVCAKKDEYELTGRTR